MKKNYFKITMLILFHIGTIMPGFGQDLTTLDEKNGFKIFTINSEINNYASDLVLLESTNEFSTYNYTKRDNSLFDLFDNHINSIHLTFDNNTKKLKKITLDIGKEYSVNHLTMLGWYLKKLYYNFEDIIGPTNQIRKPTSDCQNPNVSCKFFEDLVFDGKIIWEAQKLNLKITHKTKYDIKSDGKVVLNVINEVIFTDKDFDIKEKNSRF